MKKLLLVSSVALAAMSVSAGGMDGAYVGVSVGASQNVTKSTSDATVFAIPMKTNSATTNVGADFSANAGWGKTFNEKVYMGIEGRVGYVTGSSRKSFTVATYSGFLKISRGLKFGVGARVGYTVIENGMLYFRAGVDWQKFEARSTGFLLSDRKFTQAMFVPGVGFEWKYSECVNFNIEAEHGVALSSNKHTGSAPGAVGEIKTRHSKTAMHIGVRYKFNMPTM